MSQLSCGIIGMPNAGKSTLFNALTSAGAAVAPYPFCTIDPNIGVVPVRDSRLDRVAALVGVQNVIYQHVEYVDVAGLVRGASKGEGRGNEFLEHVRRCDALLHVVRCFDNPDVSHVQGRLDPVDDARIVTLELLLADMSQVERALEQVGKQARHDPSYRKKLDLLEVIAAHLDKGFPARTLSQHSQEASETARSLGLLTAKPCLYVANISETDLPGDNAPRVRELATYCQTEGASVFVLCANFESELASLAPEEAKPFLKDFGLKQPALERLVADTRCLLGLISFFTFNETEVRAWSVREGTTALEAAGLIHSDFAKHFIRAEVTSFSDFERAGGAKHAREQGLTRIEGRDYIVKDADVVYFRIGM